MQVVNHWGKINHLALRTINTQSFFDEIVLCDLEI